VVEDIAMCWVRLGLDLSLACYGVWLLLTAYRVVGKPSGVDEKYDAWHRQWAGSLKFLGWGWVVLTGLHLVSGWWW
jgi:hypothetical protein